MLLDLWHQCRTWHVLPRAGGLEDQPAPLVAALRICESAFNEYQAWRRDPEMSSEQSVAHLDQMIRTMRRAR